MTTSPVTVAAVQAAPVYLDAAASTEKACALIADAGARGASLVAFSETWLAGYPIFAITQVPALQSRTSVLAYLDSAITVPGPETDALCAAAARAGCDVAIGVAERDPHSPGTVYCTLVFIGADGQLLGRHRKLKPTAAERMVWAQGDGSGLVTYPRPYGRLSGLNCWEHQMVLPGYALIAQGTQFHVATWPAPPAEGSRNEILARAFAAQGACAVISVGGIYSPELFPEECRSGGMFRFDGSSHIVGPFGDVIARAQPGAEEILLATVDPADLDAARALCDISGHYSRPDVFQLHVDRRPASPIVFDDGV